MTKLTDNPSALDAYSGLPDYFQSFNLDPASACILMAMAIGQIRGLNGLSIIDQSICDALSQGWEAGAVMDTKPIPKPAKGKVV